MSGYVLDACALIALFNGEEGKVVLERVFVSGLPIRITAINVLEIAYDAVRRQKDTQAAKEVLDCVEKLGIEIVWTMTPAVLLRAAEFKSQGRISLADSIALALALDSDAKLVTADHHEFDAFEQAGFDVFEWIR
ncbi:MAG: PIN domain-containing protein [Methylococcaceae bacterium]|jgi:predicted nucleic acid-binding protein